MNLPNYWLLVVLGGVAVGLAPKLFPEFDPEEVRFVVFALCMMLIVPALSLMRKKYLGTSWREYLIGRIPLYGIWYRFRKFRER